MNDNYFEAASQKQRYKKIKNKNRDALLNLSFEDIDICVCRFQQLQLQTSLYDLEGFFSQSFVRDIFCIESRGSQGVSPDYFFDSHVDFFYSTNKREREKEVVLLLSSFSLNNILLKVFPH